MLFRFTLNNTIEGSHVISDPDGWKEIKLKLERDKEYHSLVEMVELPLRFYRTNDSVDGGYDYITNIEQTQGIDALIELLIEVSEDNGVTYETFFNGLLELVTIKDISDAESYIVECNIVRNDFWSKFFNRKSQQVDLSGTTDLDGNSRTPLGDVTIALPSQRIRQNSNLYTPIPMVLGVLWPSTFSSPDFQVDIGEDDYIQISFPNAIIDEIEVNNNIFSAATRDVIPYPMYTVKYSGTYTFDIQVALTEAFYSSASGGLHEYIDMKGLSSFSPSGTLDIIVYIQINGDVPIEFTVSDHSAVSSGTGSSANDYWTEYNYADTLTLNAGDTIKIYGQKVTSGSFGYGNGAIKLNEQVHQLGSDSANNIQFSGGIATLPFNGVTESYIIIEADTTFEDSETEAFLLRDAAESILTKIVGRDQVLYSDYLGNDTPSGCAAKYAITKGLHIRGYTMADKPMTMSFDDWWDGANPIFNLGLGYEEILGTEYIRIEDKGYFYDDDYSITFSNVDKITRSYDKDKIFKSIEIGYQKWSAESASGVDDPQTKHTYNTRFKIIGKDEKILSKFFAGSLGIEQTRRNRVEFGTDWRLDEDTIILALSDSYTIELDDDFTPITNLLNSDTRYNIRITPARNFERWKPFFNGCIQLYIPETYDFASGEGNYDMTSTGADTCDNGYLAENQDISVTTNFYHGPGVYEMEVPMSWSDYKTIRDNRNKSIRVSNTTSNYKLCKIDQMEYDHFNSIGEFTVWIKE